MDTSLFYSGTKTHHNFNVADFQVTTCLCRQISL